MASTPMVAAVAAMWAVENCVVECTVAPSRMGALADHEVGGDGPVEPPQSSVTTVA